MSQRPSKQTRIRPGRLPWLGTVHPDSHYLILLRGLLILSGTIMLPRREWGFHFRASSLQWSYIEGPGPASEDLMRRDLALHLDAYVRPTHLLSACCSSSKRLAAVSSVSYGVAVRLAKSAMTHVRDEQLLPTSARDRS